MQNIKKQFPIFSRPEAGSRYGGTNHPNMIYLDSAATTQTPSVVIDAMNDYYTKTRSNVHRGIYDLSEQATAAYEAARASIAKFLNAEREEIIFTSGTTHGLNLLAYSLTPKLSHRDNVVLTRLEHHANLVPWQQMAKHYGFTIRYIELTPEDELDLASAEKVIDANTKIVSFALVSNVLGTVAQAKKISEFAHARRALTIVDAAQAVAHLPIDVENLDCDFLVFSGHKLYGPTGIGVLYSKKALLEESLEPFFFGGDMIKSVSYTDATWAELPERFEAGTQNISGVIGLGAAVEWLASLGWDKIVAHEREMMAYALDKLKNEVTIIGPAIGHIHRVGVIAFTIPSIHPHDIAEILNQDNICIRVGFHCAEPLHRHLGAGPTARASFGVYTTKEDIDKLVKGIEKVKKIFA
ncbi:MAG: SufS family cysteine desulfurase [Candidatus Magasanikbacteria bacterium]|nr:SufS family cysteine desulfurase [Candidatus Magasanikbacteria bacterium]